ncbi:TerB family tellurite resistance protein [Methylocella silvestris]|uniref:Co-chaperone DjlA N-terminal domain-containing protein n=1 Tax=Methylocella silvestris TaxID=199596 RepID=A0A2J7TIW2_METSI|nr:TerB family tellurite resistance protein [Methylocella silvestris]PNG26686.1 hypothetical protein CR492_06750 [Methylocella silvestris]
MLDALKAFLTELGGGGAAGRSYGDDDYRLAAAALLVHVAAADGETDAAERQRLRDTLAQRFGLDAAATLELIHRAEESDRDAVDFYQFTSVLKRALDEDGRRRIVEMMWEIACADGEIHEFEDNTIWRVAELLGVSSRDRVLLRQQVAAETAAGKSGDSDPANSDPAKSRNS